MNWRVEVDGEPIAVDLAAQQASVEEVMPGVFSILLDDRSFQVAVLPGEPSEVAIGPERFSVALTDARDQAANAQKGGASGPVEIRAQMPGRVIKLLVNAGASVKAGQGLIVVEAMKMQNEVKAAKDGTLTRVFVNEGATVGAGQPLLLIE